MLGSRKCSRIDVFRGLWREYNDSAKKGSWKLHEFLNFWCMTGLVVSLKRSMNQKIAVLDNSIAVTQNQSNV